MCTCVCVREREASGVTLILLSVSGWMCAGIALILWLFTVILFNSTCWSQCEAEEVSALSLILIYMLLQSQESYLPCTLTHTHTRWPAVRVLGPRDIANSYISICMHLLWNGKIAICIRETIISNKQLNFKIQNN